MDLPDIPLQDRERLDKVADRFESEVRANAKPAIESYLQEEAYPEHLLYELLSLELELRRQSEETPQRSEYDGRFPEHVRVVEMVFNRCEVTLPQERDYRPVGHGLHVDCPHCHNPVELVLDAELEDIKCPSCGSNFSLIGDGSATKYADTVTQVAQFKLVERVGMGAFGSVWKAHDTKLDRTVAIKIPRRGQFDPEQEKAFLREAQNAAQLSHTGVVPVFEVGRDGSAFFIVSEFVRGVTLADRLTTRRPSLRESAELCVKVCDALQHAHDRGVIHRDLKPGNIMLDDADNPRLMDFGLAKRDASEISMTVDGQILGTPAYMSPEQAKGEAHQADERSDIYSVGVILFQMITGELPFRGNTRMLLHQVIYDDAPSPRQLNSLVPRDLETVCLRCLRKEPHRRYPTAADLAADLRRWMGNEPIHARPISTLEQLWRWSGKNVSKLAGLYAVAESLLNATAVGYVVQPLVTPSSGSDPSWLLVIVLLILPLTIGLLTLRGNRIIVDFAFAWYSAKSLFWLFLISLMLLELSSPEFDFEWVDPIAWFIGGLIGVILFGRVLLSGEQENFRLVSSTEIEPRVWRLLTVFGFGVPLIFAAAIAFTVLVFHLYPEPEILDHDMRNNQVAEQSVKGTPVGIVAGVKDDSVDRPTYRLSDDARGRFRIDPVTGEVTVGNGQRLQFGLMSRHSITVEAMSGESMIASSRFAIAVLSSMPPPPVDIDDAPNHVNLQAKANTYTGITVAASGDSDDVASFNLGPDSSKHFRLSDDGKVVVAKDMAFPEPQDLRVLVWSRPKRSLDPSTAVFVVKFIDGEMAAEALPVDSEEGNAISDKKEWDKDSYMKSQVRAIRSPAMWSICFVFYLLLFVCGIQFIRGNTAPKFFFVFLLFSEVVFVFVTTGLFAVFGMSKYGDSFMEAYFGSFWSLFIQFILLFPIWAPIAVHFACRRIDNAAATSEVPWARAALGLVGLFATLSASHGLYVISIATWNKLFG